MTKFNVGDKVRYKGNLEGPFTNGKEYTILSVNKFDVDVIDDYGRFDALSYTYLRNYFELVTEPVDEGTPVEASPTVIELLANISRRLYEAEKEITELNEKQAIFFDIDKLLKNRILDLERQNRVQAYEINELYKVVAERG